MTIRFTTGQDLADGHLGRRLFRDWMGDRLPASLAPESRTGATAELNRLFQFQPNDRLSASVTPFFQSEAAVAELQNRLYDLPDETSRNACLDNLDHLKLGQATVVITGQQPGFMGGPLYTLYKIATTIALARQMTALGRPTVPVFWSGDDDDDLAEALACRIWDPINTQLWQHDQVGHKGPGPSERRIVGSLSSAVWSASAAHWLQSLAGATPMTQSLTTLWQQAVAEDWPWSRLQHQFLNRFFAGSGLLIVQGRDAALHAAAHPLYEEILPQIPKLADLARRRGRQLIEGGWNAQLEERALAQNLFQMNDGVRRPVTSSDAVSSTDLRPGVLLRSLVQDWLFEPAAVVVGPGELAYLRQLDPLFDTLKISRSPLVPRLFGWLLPPRFEPHLLQQFATTGPDEDRLESMAQEVGQSTRAALLHAFIDQLQVPRQRAEQLTDKRVQRWLRGIKPTLAAEAHRQLEAQRPKNPTWVFPDGHRQERTLSSTCAAAIWGDDLAEALLTAADAHLKKGREGQWQEYLFTVSDPTWETPK